MRFIFPFILLVLLCSSCVDKATSYLQKGKLEFNRAEYEPAIEHLKEALEHGKKQNVSRSFIADANFHIAESYRRSNRINESEYFYKDAVKNGYIDEHADFWVAYAMKVNGKYESARVQFRRYIKMGTNDAYVERAKHELKNLDELAKIYYKRAQFKVKNMAELNTDGVEYSPMMYNDRTMYFTSSRGEGPVYQGHGTRFTDIFEWRFDGATSTSGVDVPLNILVNDPKRHEATVTFSPDKQTMIFSRSSNGKANDITQEIDLFESKLINGDWSEPKRLRFSLSNYWDSNPFLSPDGKTLYFASNRPDGYGGDDLWKVSRESDGTWGEVKNLGKNINTEGDEQFPYLDRRGNFYFASDGHPSFGGLDIFVYEKDEEGHRHVRNIGLSVNSKWDDFGIIFTKRDQGFFCSNRPEGKGNDDIYYFEYDFEPKYYLEGSVKGKTLGKYNTVTNTLKILPNSLIILKDARGMELETAISDSLGYFIFEVEPEKNYNLHAEHEGYLARDQIFSTMGKSVASSHNDDVFFETELILDPIGENVVVEFPPIFYPYNSWDITPKAEEVLMEMVDVMKKNPTILVELGSHTDARGTAEFNKKLSQNRAESAVEWIISKGIAKDRLTAKGYGEQEPLRLLKDTLMFTQGMVLTELYLDSLLQVGDTLIAETGHQLNRRSEFKIVGQIEKPVDLENIEVIDSGKKEAIIEKQKLKYEQVIMNRYLQKNKILENEADAGEPVNDELQAPD